MNLKSLSMRVLLGQIQAQEAKGSPNKEYLEALKTELARRKEK